MLMYLTLLSMRCPCPVFKIESIYLKFAKDQYFLSDLMDKVKWVQNKC